MRNLKKNFLIPLIVIIFLVGFILGRITDDTGRYTSDLTNNQLAIFDSKTGKVYVKDSRESKTKYFVIDVINAEIENYKPKNQK